MPWYVCITWSGSLYPDARKRLIYKGASCWGHSLLNVSFGSSMVRSFSFHCCSFSEFLLAFFIKAPYTSICQNVISFHLQRLLSWELSHWLSALAVVLELCVFVVSRPVWKCNSWEIRWLLLEEAYTVSCFTRWERMVIGRDYLGPQPKPWAVVTSLLSLPRPGLTVWGALVFLKEVEERSSDWKV